MKLKNSSCNETQKHNCGETQKLKLWRNLNLQLRWNSGQTDRQTDRILFYAFSSVLGCKNMNCLQAGIEWIELIWRHGFKMLSLIYKKDFWFCLKHYAFLGSSGFQDLLGTKIPGLLNMSPELWVLSEQSCRVKERQRHKVSEVQS